MHNTSITIRPRDHGDDRKKQQERLQVCENNWVRRITGVNRIDKRRMEEDSVKESFTRKLLRSRLRWAGRNNGRGTIDEENECAWSGG